MLVASWWSWLILAIGALMGTGVGLGLVALVLHEHEAREDFRAWQRNNRRGWQR